MSALVTPPGQSPDEPKHVVRAAALLHGAILGERKMAVNQDSSPHIVMLLTGLKVDAGLYAASQRRTTIIAGLPVETASDFLAIRAQPADHTRSFVAAPNTATYFPAAYLPATLGLALGLAVHAPPFACFLLARMFMLAAFLLLGLLALWITAYGEAVLLMVLIMPMTLFLAGSVTQDSVLIGLACLTCAALTRKAKSFRLLALVSFVLFLGGKPPYILLLGAFLLPLFEAGFWRRLRDVAIACVPVLTWVALVVAFVAVPFRSPAYHPGPLYAGDRSVWLDHNNTAANLHILLTPATRLITLPWTTAKLQGLMLLRSMIGNLGSMQIPLAESVYWAWGFCGAVAVLGLVFSRRENVVSPGTQVMNFLVIGLLIVGTYWALMITSYLDWTNVGLAYIDGMQGRYLLPLLPFLLLGIPGFRWRFTLPPLLPALPAIAMGMFDIGYIPMKLVWTYYLH